jgi:hypothetical protein
MYYEILIFTNLGVCKFQGIIIRADNDSNREI